MDEHDQQDPLQRPAGACVTCPPPKGHAWTRADDRHATCSGCYDLMRARLAEVAERYLLLDSRPASSSRWGGRGSPGFVSKPPISVHIVSMKDPRSSQDARVWVGRDGRVHSEDTRPPLSVYGVMSTLAWSIAEHRRDIHGESTPPGDRDDVFALVGYVDAHIGFVTRHAELAVEVDTALRSLLAGMRPVTGAGRRKIGPCPKMVSAGPDAGARCRCGHESAQHDNDAVSGERRCHEAYCACRVFLPIGTAPELAKVRCNAMLYTSAQLDEDTVTCPGCGHSWHMSGWLTLGDDSDLEYAEPAS